MSTCQLVELRTAHSTIANGARLTRLNETLPGSEMAHFRQDPRFQAFVTRLGLMDYWKQHGPPDDCD